MKFVALLSGGKDSCYNIVHCTANGHELVAAASLRPPAGQGEIDSFMYQTVGQDAIELVAAALEVPLFRRTIHGSAIEQGGEYGDRAGKTDQGSEGVNGDETEDMFALLSEVKEAYPDIQGVSVGAILSNYQRVRVDNVCQRLGLTPLCYLWQRDQRELMSEMIAAGVEAILIKVAGIGLREQHLGKTLAQMEPLFHNLNDKFGAHICGEGGEYETLTLDCPAFKRRIRIKETETVIHSDHSFATVAYLQIKDAVLEDKPQSTPSAPTIPPLLDTFATEMEQNLTDISIENEVISCFDTIKDLLARSDINLQPKHIVNTMLLLSDMDLFPHVNKAYAQYFGTSPPSRACVAVDLPEGTRVRVSCVAYRDHPTSNPRSGLHVQGISYWAPANIGPYKPELGRHALNAYTQASRRGDQQIPGAIVAAKSLPKGAMIEVQVLAHSNIPQSTDPEDDDDGNPGAEMPRVSTDSSARPNYEHNIRRIGESSFLLAFVNNAGLSSGPLTPPPLLHHEALAIVVFHCPGADLRALPRQAAYIPVRGILSASGTSWDTVFCVHIPIHSKAKGS
ncbi:hypothetical protein RSAG8_00721, partial [Rhizoctonia solani AG-8 WAC10335]